MYARFLTHARLDRLLARLARRPERFAEDSARLAAALDRRRLDLEISDPDSWRGAREPARIPLERQFDTEIRILRPMDRQEERRLALRIEFARIRAEQAPAAILRRRQEWHALRLEMVERNLYLVLVNVERYRRFESERADLIQAGAVALFRAVDKFDWRRGVLFRTYAVHWLREGFRSQLYDFGRTVRVPAYVLNCARHVRIAIERVGDPQASVEEIAREAGVSPARVTPALTAARSIRSLDAPLGSGAGAPTLASELAMPDDEVSCGFGPESVSIDSGVEAALAGLDPRERRTVELHFGIGCARPHVFAEIAGEFGVSQPRVRQLYARALSKLRAPRLRTMLEPLIG
jgi:DNA-directed RNA polymerase sigma subunit (sigma70/sigma32)